MKRIINKAALVAVLMVAGVLGVNAEMSNLKANAFTNSLKAAKQHLQNGFASPRVAAVAKAKTEKGKDTMCLAMDLREVQLTIADAIIEPKYEAEAKESIDLLLYHLKGTTEGNMLDKMSSIGTATMQDYQRTVGVVERSLLGRYTGEELWAFNIGLGLSDVYDELLFGSEKGFNAALERLAAYVNRTEGYGSVKEIEILKSIAKSAEIKVWSDQDFESLDSNLNGFVDLYFDEV